MMWELLVKGLASMGIDDNPWLYIPDLRLFFGQEHVSWTSVSMIDLTVEDE